MKQSYKSAIVTLGDRWVALKFISDKLAQDLSRLLDKYGFGS